LGLSCQIKKSGGGRTRGEVGDFAERKEIATYAGRAQKFSKKVIVQQEKVLWEVQKGKKLDEVSSREG